MEFPQIEEKEVPPKPRMSSQAIVSLSLAVLSLPLGCFSGVPAALVGHAALRNISRSGGRLLGYEIAMAGTVLGWTTTGLSVVVLVTAATIGLVHAQRLTQSTEQLRRIGIGMHNYHDQFKSLPWTGVDYVKAEDQQFTRREQLSWRVRLLLDIGEEELYDAFDFNQPWDSPHNNALIERMPDVYRSPNHRANNYRTVYQVVVLPNQLEPKSRQRLGGSPAFDSHIRREHGTAHAPRFASIVDGLSNVIMVVETDADHAVIWTKPDDWELHADDIFRGVEGGFLAVAFDGSVHYIPGDMDEEALLGLLMADDGRPARFPGP